MRTKKLKWGNPLFVLFLAVAGIFGVSSAILSENTIESPVVEKAKADAITENKEATRVFVVVYDDANDGWAGGQQNMCLQAKITVNSFSSDSGFTTSNMSSITSFPRAYSVSVSGTTIYATFVFVEHGWDVEANGNKYELVIPWYITSCDVEYYTYHGWDCYLHDKGTGNKFKSDDLTVGNDYLIKVYKPRNYNNTEYWAYPVQYHQGSDYVYAQNKYTVTYDVESYDSEIVFEGGKINQSSPTKTGHHFVNWYKEDTFENVFSKNDPVTSDLDLYAKWEENTTVYFVNGHSWGSPHVHYWGGTGSGSTWPGETMTATEAKIYCLVGDSWYLITIYKYEILDSPSKLIFNGTTPDSKNEQTDKDGLDAEDGGIYWYGIDASIFSGVADYLVSFMNSMGSYTYNGQSYSKSICNLSGASSFVSQYNTLASGTSDVATSIANSTINTYSTPETSTTTTADIKIPTLISQVSKNASNGVYGAYRNFSPFDLFNGEDNLSTIIIIAASSIALVSIGALSILIIKKRKTKEE